jgi:hypothetical protein
MQHPQHYRHIILSYINNLINPSILATDNLNESGTTKLNNSTTLMSPSIFCYGDNDKAFVIDAGGKVD